MRDVPSDVGDAQAAFIEAVVRVLGEAYEIIDTNPFNDPFEPDIILMDEDEWVFRILCYYDEEPEDGSVCIFPRTFDMRKWVVDTSDEPTFLVLGAGESPDDPEYLFFSRFFNFPSRDFDIESGKRHLLNWMRSAFFRAAIDAEFERIYSP